MRQHERRLTARARLRGSTSDRECMVVTFNVGTTAEHLLSLYAIPCLDSAKLLRLCAVKHPPNVDTLWIYCGQLEKTKLAKQNTLTRWGVGRSFRLPFGTERQTAERKEAENGSKSDK